MLRRTVPAALAAAVCLSALSALPARAAEPLTGTFTLDRMDLVEQPVGADQRTREAPSQAVYPDATVQPATLPNAVRLVHASGQEVVLAPPAGQQFVAGTSFTVDNTQSATAGTFAPIRFCSWGQWTGVWGTGTATVLAATYADGVLASLAADVSWACYDGGQWENVRSAVRVASDLPYALVRASLVGDEPRAAAGGSAPFAVRVVNAGTAPATLAASALDLQVAGSYAITGDGCAGVTLAPGEGCDVTGTFAPATLGPTNGWHGALLWARVEGYPRAAGVPARLGGRAVPNPSLPSFVTAVEGAGGVVVLAGGHPTHGGTTSYEYARRADAESPWETLGTREPGTGYAGFTDTTLADGASAEYAVRAAGPLGVSAYSTALPMTRPVTPRVPGEVDALVFDTDRSAPWPVVVDAADTPAWSSTVGWLEATTPADGGVRVPVPLVAGPGSYPVTMSPVHYPIRNYSSCTALGTLTVRSALYDESGRAVSYSADFAGTCDGTPFHYAARYRATDGYRAVDAAQPAGPWYVRTGTTVERTVTLTSAGSEPVTFGAAGVGGQYQGEYQVVANGCQGLTLPRGASCDVTVRVTPGGTGERTAWLSVAADTPRGERRVPLLARGVTAPGTPYPLEVYRVVGRARLWFAPSGGDGGAPLTGFHVYRSTNGGAWALLGTVPKQDDAYVSYDDDTVVPGVSYKYAVTAFNAVAESAKREGTALRAPRSEIVHTHGAPDSDWGLFAQNERSGSSGVTSARFTVRVDGTDHFSPAVSPDGRTLVWSGPSPAGYGLYRGDFAGTTPVLLTTLAGHEVQPAFSPDGRTLAFTNVAASGARSVWTMPAAGGPPVRRTSAASDPSWLPDSETLVVTDLGSTLRLLKVSRSGTRTAISGTVNGADPAVSPDGKWLAFTQWHQPHEHWFLSVVPIGGGTPRYVSVNADAFEPEWRRDGARIYYTSSSEHGSWVSSYGWSPASRAPFGSWAGVTDGGQEQNPAFRTLGLHLTDAPHVTGRSARIAFATTVPLPGESTTCSLDGATPVACTSPWRKAALSAGTHTLTIRSKAAGQPDTLAVHTWRVDATPPVVSVTGPGSAVTLRGAVTAAYAASGAVSYDVRYRTAPASGGYSAYAYPAAWQRTTAKHTSVPAKAGTEVCFSVRARDAYGNLSAWTADRCSAIAYDDRALAATPAWRRATSAAAYLGTLTSAVAKGAVLSRANVTAARVYVVAQRCRGCGSLDVSVGGVLLGRISLDGAAGDRVVFALPRRAAPLTGTLRLVAVSAAPVRVDGVAVLRR